MEPHPDNIERKVMENIATGKVKLRSRYIFVAERLGLGSGIVLSVLLAVLFCSLTLWYLRATDNLVYLSFGEGGWLAFLESFPYAMVIVFVLAIFVAGWLLKHSGMMYKTPFGYVALSLLGVVVLGGVVGTSTSIAEQLEGHLHGGVAEFLLHHGLHGRHHGIAGRICEIGTGYMVLQTPDGQWRVDTSALWTAPSSSLFHIGDFAVLIGERHGDRFAVRQIRRIDADDIPMIGNSVQNQFGNFRPPSNQTAQGQSACDGTTAE